MLVGDPNATLDDGDGGQAGAALDLELLKNSGRSDSASEGEELPESLPKQ